MRDRMISALRPIAILVAVTVLISASGVTAFFVGDDFDFLRLADRMDGVGDALTLSFWGEWEPLWYLSWYIDFELWGFNPVGYHVTNTFWLTLLVVSLYGLLRVLRPQAPLVAWSAALLFATHPLHDEAVVYLAARGHVMAAALSVAALLAWAGATRHGEALGQAPAVRNRNGWLAAALVLAFLAALAKEIALTLPAWAAVLAWSEAPSRPRRRGVIEGVRAAAFFAVPGVATLVLRYFVVGLDSGKLTAGVGEPLRVVVDLWEQLPAYALLGGVPIPFAFSNFETIERFRALGLLLLVGVVAGWSVPVLRCVWRSRAQSSRLAMYGLGLAIIVTSLAPVFWADLPLRRRYLFTPSIGIAILAALAIDRMAERSRRAALLLLALLVVAGGVGMQQRNALYRGAGEVTRGLIETVCGAPLGQPAKRQSAGVVLLTLPRAYGGDFLSGAYLLHHTDVASALRLAGIDNPRVRYPLKCEYADDYHAETRFSAPDTLEVRVQFRTAKAFDAALARSPEGDRRGEIAEAKRIAVDAATRILEYQVRLTPDLPADRDIEWYVYSDREFRALAMPGVD